MTPEPDDLDALCRALLSERYSYGPTRRDRADDQAAITRRRAQLLAELDRLSPTPDELAARRGRKDTA